MSRSGSLLCILYVSHARFGFGPVDLTAIVDVSVPKNRLLGITGILFYDSGRFLQVLEGPEEAVRTVLATIKADRRHYGLSVLVDAPLPARHFPDWGMAGGAFDALPVARRRTCRGLMSWAGAPAKDKVGREVEALIASFSRATAA